MLLVIYVAALYIAYRVEESKYMAFYGQVDPFPLTECQLHIMNDFLRDALLAGLLLLCYKYRKRIIELLPDYILIVSASALYLLSAALMIYQLELDTGILTLLACGAGLVNNVLPVALGSLLLMTGREESWRRELAGLIYATTCSMIIFDTCYFWTTSMHVESVVFKNFNLYAAWGVIGTADKRLLLAVAIVVLLLSLTFYLGSKVRKLEWRNSLVALLFTTIITNALYGMVVWEIPEILDACKDTWVEIQIEKTKSQVRDMLTVSQPLNFCAKLLYRTEEKMQAELTQEPQLKDEARQRLLTLGIEVEHSFVAPKMSSYDRIILLVLESVPREYIAFYNKQLPKGLTPYLDALHQRYPHVDNYYAASMPTTFGLNSMFRSQYIFDDDLVGAKQPSLYRSLQAAGWRGIYLSGSSRYYENEFRQYPEQFGMAEYYVKEDLEKRGYTGASYWGYHNDVLYTEGLRLLQENRDNKLLLVIKTLDMHQPFPYTGLKDEEMPEEVRKAAKYAFRGMYWVDKVLGEFFRKVEQAGLMDERTLFVVTADHNPHSGGEYKDIILRERDKRPIAPIPLLFVSANTKPLQSLVPSMYASQVDLAPTLLYLAGVATPREFVGRNLLLQAKRDFALGYFGGKAYYYAEGVDSITDLDEAKPPTPEQDALADYVTYEYNKNRWRYGMKRGEE